MKRLAFTALLAVLTSLAGCWPRQLIVWSPDGSRAAVLLNDELRLTDGEGKLSKVLAPDILAARWSPDGKWLCVIAARRATRWKDVAAAVSDEQTATVIRHAEAVRQATPQTGWQARLNQLAKAEELTQNEAEAALLYLLDRYGSPDANAESPKPSIESIRVASLDGASARLGSALHRSLVNLREPVVSPDGRCVAVAEGRPQGSVGRLFVAAIAGGAPARKVADRSALPSDWTPDGRGLVYCQAMATSSDPDVDLGTIQRRTVRGRDGELLKDFPEPEALAGVLFSRTTRVRCLGDGRVLFSSMEVHLPTTSQDMPTALCLFAVDPTRQATVTRMLPRSAGGEELRSLDYFQLSPNQQAVAIPGPNGSVAVLQLASGKMEIVQPAKDVEEMLRAVPTWRSDTELCFLVPAQARTGKGRRPEFVLWSAKKTRPLSRDWPDELMKKLMPEEKGGGLSVPGD